MTDLCALYVLFVLPALIFGLLPASFVLERVRFRIADALQLLAPYAVWMGLFFAGRVALGILRPQPGTRTPLQALACSCLLAIVFWRFFPGLPE